MEDKLLSIDEVSRYLKIPKSTIYKLSQKKELPSSKIGKQLRFRRSSIDNWLAMQEQDADKLQSFLIKPQELSKPPLTKNVLLIDDDKLVLKTITKFLNLQGYNVDVAENGEEALKKIDKSNFDLMIIDVRMPGLNGIETIKRLRKLQTKHNRPPIPEIVITGFMDTQAEREAKSLGITDYIHKPFSISEFIETIEKKLAIFTCIFKDYKVYLNIAITKRE